MGATSKRRAGGSGRPLVIILGLGILLVGAWLGSRVWRGVVAPWSTAADGATLQGDWTGPLALADGTAGALRLALEDTVDQMEDAGSPNLAGTATYCLGDATGELEVLGWAAADGTIGRLEFRSYEAQPAWLFYADGGQYDGETLTVNGRYSFDPTGQHIARSDVPEPTLTVVLQRGDELACP